MCGSPQTHVSVQCALLLETPKWLPPNLEAYCPLVCVPVAIGDKIRTIALVSTGYACEK